MTKKKKNLRKAKEALPLPVADEESQPQPPPPPIHVPDDVIIEILSLLPVKSLLQFTCVCKSWKLIISNPQFVKLHLRRSSTNMADFTHIKLLSEIRTNYDDRRDYQPHVSLYSVPLLFSPQYPKGHLFHPMAPGFRLIGVCNGLVSFIKWEFDDTSECTCTCWVRFWNPATRLWSRVSQPLSFYYQKYLSYCTFGFGYDGVNDTYKAVVVFYYDNDSEESQQSVANVYDMGASCWRSIQSFPHVPHDLQISHSSWSTPQNGVYVSGTLNWVLKLSTQLSAIVSLDLATEEHSQMSLPCFSPGAEYFFLILGALEDSLCVLYNEDDTGFVIWHMKEFGAHESWIQLFNFGFKEDLIRMNPYGIILSKNDEVLLMSREEVILYNQRDDIFKVNSGLDRYMGFSYWNFQNYVESLVSPR